MAEEININLTFYQCRHCKHIYKDKKTAQRCEDYCSSHDTYNKKIAKKGISVKR